MRPVSDLCAALRAATLLAALFLASLGAGLLVGPSAFAQDAPAPEPAPAPIAVESDAASDAAIRTRIRALFAEIDGLEGVRVRVDAGVVTLDGEVLEPGAAARAEELATRVASVAAVENQISQEQAVSRRLAPIWDRTEERVFNLVGLLPLLGIAALVFALVAFIGVLVARSSWPWDRLAPNGFIAQLMRQTVRLAFVILGLVLALDVLGATALLGTVLGAAGLVGLAVGFAVRDTVENYIASILLSLRQPFRPNDLVLIEGVEGHVTAMTSRATVLTTLESNRVRIPNSTVFKAVITNYSNNPERRFDFRVGVETDDLKHAVDLGLETIRTLPFILRDPAPIGFIEEVGDSAIVLFFGAWIDQRETSWPKAKSEAIRLVMQAFAAADIGVPEPIYRLRFDQAGAVLKAVEEGEASVEAPSSTPRRAAPVSQAPGDVSREIESDVEEGVARERAGLRDLLSEDAPQEVASDAAGG